MKKELTNSNIDRQNILNNSLAIKEIQEQIGMKGFHFEGKIWFTKKQVTDFFEVDRKTIDRYLEANEDELRKNGYEVFTGERLREAKTLFKRDINVPLYEDENGLDKVKSNLGLFDFRSFLNLGMLLIESEKARELRQIILDITIDENTFQNSFMSLGFNGKKKIRAKDFLEQMDKVIPYERFLKIVGENYTLVF